MTDLGIAIVLAGALSVLIAAIEIPSKSKTDLKSCKTGSFGIYLVILIVGNISTTLLASTVINAALEEANSFPGPVWFWYAFVGVFGFEAILQNVNVTLFDNGVLSINDWISKARNNAIAKALTVHADAGERYALYLAEKIKMLPENELNAMVLQHLGADKVQELNDKATQAAAPSLVKALALAYERPDQADAIAQAIQV